jgi:hypothetical protein
MVRAIFHLVALVAEVRKHDVGGDEVAAGIYAAVVADCQGAILIGAVEGPPDAVVNTRSRVIRKWLHSTCGTW